MCVRLAEQSVCRGHQQNSDREDTRSHTGADGWPRLAQQPCDAVGQRSTIGGDRGTEMRRAIRFQLRQRTRIRERITADRDGHIVAAQFALGANVPRYPPDRGVIKQQGFGNALQNVDQIIVPPDMRQLMQQQRLQMLRRKTAERSDRHQHHGTQPADHGRHLHQRGDQQSNRTIEANARAEFSESLLPFRRRTPDQHRPHAYGNYPATGQTDPEHGRPGHPDNDHPRQ